MPGLFRWVLVHAKKKKAQGSSITWTARKNIHLDLFIFRILLLLFSWENRSLNLGFVYIIYPIYPISLRFS